MKSRFNHQVRFIPSTFFYTDGPSLPPEQIISSHNVNPPVQANCNYLCYTESKCVGFNFRTKTNDNLAVNCQLTNMSRKRENMEEGEWTFFYNVDEVRDTTGDEFWT